MTTLFISDLHLHESRPHITEGFQRFLREQAQSAEALYILGDFFDAWVGDDDDSPLALETAADLRQLSDQGVGIYLMHGNRDFLLGGDFASAAGAKLIDDPTTIQLGDRRALLMHGDSLCTRDVEYMAFRAQMRSPQWQAQALAQPLAARRQLATELRNHSKSMTSMKAEDIMDVTPEEVVRVMEEANVDLLIHGHTHRPDRHQLTVNDKPAERIVLGDWHDHGWCVRAEGSELSLESWPLKTES
ncbi:UDP-2,3-diacylglucosamine diphosphatase [Marinimicrobium sp. ABcell2]|uniref:UDP-2,3-diacylglucosamine diphosphatase n=1 Tax=Marinimicrobium sp. ABcell2 TaxID=3069751 RepID=UPI0027B6C9BB|nr:UDP-2,3-diacylglucosamine diphosphatase [Marinimicrobium sp. ABcell2]MDQ2078006.1 UDP-2,3-diacylglucosamine diphosphatase [Marinimicrobium sp. ABcell2]